MNEKELIKFIKGECKKYNINFILKNTKTVKFTDGFRCSGYFDEKNLVVAKNRPDYIQILVHEYCHLTQWREQIPLWKDCVKSCAKLDEWLSGNSVVGIEKHVANCRDLELDNEKRSVALIKEFELPIDVESYTRKANSYVHFYNYMLMSRRWCSTKNSPYTNKRLIESMSPKFNMNYKKLSKKIEKIFIEEGF
jgi:hypothetical protein